jgi:hypothetical protein
MCWYATTGADGIARIVVRPASTTTFLASYAGAKLLDHSLSRPTAVSVRW